MSLATKKDVELVVGDIEYRLKQYYLRVDKHWHNYGIFALFPSGQYLGNIYSRYDIFQNDEKNWC